MGIIPASAVPLLLINVKSVDLQTLFSQFMPVLKCFFLRFETLDKKIKQKPYTFKSIYYKLSLVLINLV